MALQDSYATVVEVGPVPQPEICLIDIPFAHEFDVLSSAIHAAANALGLKPVRMDSLETGNRFTIQVAKYTRKASLVVAVCSPIPAQGGPASPNPNVMFELGMACALGKPLILLTTDTKELPSDIRDIAAVEYRPEESETILRERIENHMRRVWLRVERENPFVLPNEDGIWVARAKHRMLLTPDFWKCFSLLFTYANNVRNEADLINREYAYELGRQAEQILDGSATGLRALWRSYASHYTDETAEVLMPPAGLRNALARLEQLSTPAESRVRAIESYSVSVQRSISRFQDVHQNTVRICERLLANGLASDERAELSGQLTEFVERVKGLVTLSGGLVDRLVELVASGFEDAGAESEARAKGAAI